MYNLQSIILMHQESARIAS